MSAESQQYKKGACTACGGHIEFPAEAMGVTIACPHCGAQTQLLDNLRPAAPARPNPPAARGPTPAKAAKPKSAPEPAQPKTAAAKFSTECPGCGLEVSIQAFNCPGCGAVIRERSRISAKLVVTSVLGLALVGGGIVWATGGKLKLPKFKLPEFAKKSDVTASPTEGGSNSSTGGPSTAPTPAPPPKPVKRSNVFKVVDFEIERTPGRSLVYVVGNVTNDTDKQQFGVKVTFDLLDRSQKNVGQATDYIAVIEPGNGWQFKALVLDTNAASAKLLGLDVDKQ